MATQTQAQFNQSLKKYYSVQELIEHVRYPQLRGDIDTRAI